MSLEKGRDVVSEVVFMTTNKERNGSFGDHLVLQKVLAVGF